MQTLSGKIYWVTVTFEPLMQSTSLYTFLKGSESNNPFLVSNFTKNVNLSKLQKNTCLTRNFSDGLTNTVCG